MVLIAIVHCSAPVTTIVIRTGKLVQVGFPIFENGCILCSLNSVYLTTPQVSYFYVKCRRRFLSFSVSWDVPYLLIVPGTAVMHYRTPATAVLDYIKGRLY